LNGKTGAGSRNKEEKKGAYMGESLKVKGRRIITLANQKGGVGKTSSALCIGSGLAMAGQKTLLIDGDPQGNLTLFFDREKTNDLAGLFREMVSTARVKNAEEYIIKNVRENLDLIPLYNRNLRNDLSENQLSDITLLFIDMVSQFKDNYDWVIIDCSPSNGRLEKLMVSVSDAVLVPLEFQLFSIAGLNGLMEDIKNCGTQVRKNIAVEALLFIKAENRLNRVIEYRKIFETFYIPIYEICKSEYLPRSIEAKKTVWEFAPSSIVAKDYFKVIEKLFIG
jgi:chromosome partitioning protein